MKKIILSIVALVSAVAIHAQEDQVLMTIAGEPVMVSEFKYIYEKNNQETSIEPKTLDEYLDLFINFKLKVKEAESQGIDTTEAFLKELKGYRAQATPKYMRDNDAIDSLINLSYQHLCKDRRAAHITIQCPLDANDSIVADALARIKDARERVTLGKQVIKGKGKKARLVREPKEDFFAVAKEVSTDPSVKENGGELGWIIPFRYVYPFEQAVYATEIGSVSEVFRTAYGFHIALVEEEREHLEVRAQHIMKMVPRGNDSLELAKKAEIDAVYANVLAGADFSEVARRESDDKGSAMRGGDLGWFGRGYMVKPFEDAAYALKDSGEICAPIRSAFGWHIIRLEGKKGIAPLAEMRSDIEKKVSRDERMQEQEKSFLNKTRAEYNLPAEMTDDEVRQYADEHLEEKYEDLKNLVREYHDGILLFDVSLAEVWDKATQDTVGLTEFFKKHKKEYTWEKPKYKGYVVYCKDQASAKAAKAIIKSAPAEQVEMVMNERLNLDSVTYVKFQKGLWECGQNPAVDKFGFKQKKVELQEDADFPVVFCVGKVLKQPEEYSDERGKVTTAYQDALEVEWLKKLREKFPVVLNKEVFDSLK